MNIDLEFKKSFIVFIDFSWPFFFLDLQMEVSNLTLNGIPAEKTTKDITVFQQKTGKPLKFFFLLFRSPKWKVFSHAILILE